MLIKYLFIVYFLYSSASAQAVFKKILLDDPQAVCLDGTPGAYYIDDGVDFRNIVLYF